MTTEAVAKKRIRFRDTLGIVPVLFFAYYMVATIDHLVMVNSSYYPTFFAEKVSVPIGDDGGIEGLEGICNGQSWDFYDKRNGYFMRCQTLLTGSWTIPKTYLIENTEELFKAIREVYGDPA